ncbi:MAG: hypothetical protein A2151_06250 [Candidatus Muproteobacteria bacterium RBG_16_65_34]|uniref:DUF599 domain-containing protein n=1 Tax=Candidatus Muproteobacteria bacterium RBG_16_65_34 TaxID=1817760 RepID=A0A1F6TV04_9PROT|nr:MAG: hypothetical protein A2151_06250 [Candidatus Muproteobacteria bacterium RBG_16_65_34]
MREIPTADIVSLVWFVAVWIGYTWYADRGPQRARSLRAVMHTHRYEWMRRMLERDNRIVDANILGNLLQSVSFFASTTLLILAGLVTILGSTDKAILLVRELPFAARTSLVLWELKLLVLIVIFVHAFFKFTWALRQFNYCSVLVGAAPNPGGKAADDAYARRAAEVSTLASKDFNQGLRAYYLSLAALAWFISPWVFMLATTVVIAVLYWREYHSEALRTLEPAVGERR